MKFILKFLDKITNPMNVDFKKLDAQDRARDAATRSPNSGGEIPQPDANTLFWLEVQRKNQIDWSKVTLSGLFDDVNINKV